jgi:hypothetical protein
MRSGTTIMIILLLVAILTAGLYQFLIATH